MTLSSPPTLAAANVHATSVSPGVETKSDRQVALRIESKALLEHQVADAADETAYFVRTDGTKALLEKHDVRVVDTAAVPAIVVHLSWVRYADSVYGVKIETVQPGKPPKLVETFECECGDSELTAAVIARLSAALEQLDEPEAVVTDPVVEPEGKEPGTGQTRQPKDDSPRKPLGTLGKTGIGVGVVGASALIAGGIVYSRGVRFDPLTGERETQGGRDFGPPGIAMLVTGGAALVTGAVLLIVDRTKPRKQKAVAVLLPSPRGFVLTGRF